MSKFKTLETGNRPLAKKLKTFLLNIQIPKKGDGYHGSTAQNHFI